MSRKTSEPAMLPYRDTNNTSIKYVPNATANVTPTTTQDRSYDSDYEPLIEDPNKNFAGELSEHDVMHFTATGRPAPKFKASALMSLGAGEAYSMPQLLPKRYTDDSIIPAIVTNIIPSPKAAVGTEVQHDAGRRKSFLSKFKSGEKKLETNKDGTIKMKVIYMPRRDYIKFFARDSTGQYIGSEPFKQWTENELETSFGQYTPKPDERKGYRVPT